MIDERFRVQIALTDTPFTASPTWTNFTDITRGAQWSYRRDGMTGQCAPSTASLVAANRDGRWDAATGLGGSPWAGNVRPWLGVRILCSTSATFSPSTVLWRGFLADLGLMTGEFDGYVDLGCVDLLGVAAVSSLPDIERPEELPGVRAAAIIAALGIPSGFINQIDDGTVVMPAATVSGQALSALQECARAEGGHVFCGRDGRINFVNRFHWLETARTGFVLGESLIKQTEIPQTLTRFDRIEQAAVSGVTGATMTVGSVTSGFPAVARREMDVPAVWNADADALADWLFFSSNYSGDRIDAVSVDVMNDTTTILEAIEDGDLKWQDSVDVSLTPVHGHELTGEFWVEEETHVVTTAGVWRCDLGLSPVATPRQTASANFLRFGETVTAAKVGGY